MAGNKRVHLDADEAVVAILDEASRVGRKKRTVSSRAAGRSSAQGCQPRLRRDTLSEGDLERRWFRLPRSTSVETHGDDAS